MLKYTGLHKQVMHNATKPFAEFSAIVSTAQGMSSRRGGGGVFLSIRQLWCKERRLHPVRLEMRSKCGQARVGRVSSCTSSL
jgi:hypothetical protein